ncbi:hypothetical protein GGX14DRAFT_559406 [Mycena pura]|uniref:F-box domain-containing protein n=1 Tax=Mycena pura TaxID=153505 RepID=A0AAD6VRF4_9AGAR|nr:hypothetical protein GGX14DRAFT_559406 [Mycena pura]
MLADLPEELLERILANAVVAKHPADDGAPRIVPLLVCRAFYRIVLPFVYHNVVLHTLAQSLAVLHTLRAHPALARSVRTLVIRAPGPADAEILRAMARAGGGLLALDITLPGTCKSGGAEPDAALLDALRELRSLRDLTVRKGAGTYLSQPAPRALLAALADAVASCPALVRPPAPPACLSLLLTPAQKTVALSFPLSADPALAPLVAALAAAPALHTFRTPLPSLWAPPLLAVSANPALAQICLGDDLPPRARTRGARDGEWGRRPVLGSSLCLHAARQHARLCELLLAGTTVIGWRDRGEYVQA